MYHVIMVWFFTMYLVEFYLWVNAYMNYLTCTNFVFHRKIKILRKEIMIKDKENLLDLTTW
jgi:5'(3')-deoxyribonucleotidase